MNKAELIKSIPGKWSSVISFIENISENCYFEKDERGLMVDEVEIGNKQFLIEIDIMNCKITFIDHLTSFDDERNELPKEPVNKLIELARKNNMHFYNRGDGNDNYHWYGLQIEAKQFNYDELKSFIEEWHSHNQSVESTIKNA